METKRSYRRVKPLKTHQRTCACCGCVFVVGRDQARNKTCSKECHSAVLREAGYKTPTSVCLGCGVEFRRSSTNTNKGLYCTRKCAFHNYKSWMKFNIRPAGAKRLKYTPVIATACKYCSSVFFQKDCVRKRTFCRSRQCSNKHSALSLARKRDDHRRAITLTCRGCDKQFSQSVIRGSGRAFCSIACSKRYYRRGQNHPESRARRFGVPCVYGIKPDAVLRRDRYRCQLCGRATPKRLRGTSHDAAPEVDHIIPLSRGGGHTWDNVQCACRRCNSLKADSELGQLRLAI